MRLVHALGAAVAATTLVASVAQATVTTSLVQIPVDPGAATTIGAGSTVRTYQLQVTQTGEKWDVGSMRITLAQSAKLSGYFYAAPNHVTDPGLQATTTNISPTRNYAPTDVNYYDTFVTSPAAGMNPTAQTVTDHLRTTGSSDFPNVGPASNSAIHPLSGTNTTAGNQTLDIVWGDMAGNQATSATTVTVAQFTIVGNTGAFIRGYNGGSGAPNTPQYFNNNGTGAIAASTALGLMYLPIRGDVNLDGFANQTDLTIVLQNFGKPGTQATGDLNGDGFTNQTDLTLNLQSFGNGMGDPPATGAALGSLVPEPGIGSLLLGGLLMGAARRRSRRA